MSQRKCSFQKKKITTVNSFFHYDDIRLLYERIQYLQLHNTFFSINHCWVVNNMDAGKISICNNWIRKWSGAEETIFDLAIFLCIRRRYSLLLSHACIIHIRLLNNGEWSDYWLYYQYFCWHTQLQIIKKYAKFSQNIYLALATLPSSQKGVLSRWNLFSSATDYICEFNYYKWKFCQHPYYFKWHDCCWITKI